MRVFPHTLFLILFIIMSSGACTRISNQVDKVQVVCGEDMGSDRVFQIQSEGRPVPVESIQRLSLGSHDIRARLTVRSCFFLEPEEVGNLVVLHESGDKAWLGVIQKEEQEQPRVLQLTPVASLNARDRETDIIFADFCPSAKTYYKAQAPMNFTLHLASLGNLPGLKVTAHFKTDQSSYAQELLSTPLALSDLTPSLQLNLSESNKTTVYLSLEDLYGRTLISPACDFVVSRDIPSLASINKTHFFPGMYVELGDRANLDFSIQSKIPIRSFQLVMGSHKAEFVPFKDGYGQWMVIAPMPALSGPHLGRLEIEDEAGQTITQTFSVDFGRRVFMDAPVKIVRLSADERRMLLINDRGIVEVREVDTLEVLYRKAMEDKVINAAIDADGSHVALSFSGKTLAIDIASGKSHQLSGKFSNKAGNLGINGKGQVIGVIDDSRLTWFDGNSGQSLDEISTLPAKIKFWTQNEAGVVYSTDAGQIYQDKRLLADCRPLDINNERLALAKKGSTLVYNCGNTLLARKGNADPITLLDDIDVRELAVSDDGLWAIAGSAKGEWYVFDLIKNEHSAGSFKSTISSVGISADNRFAIVTSEDGNALIYSLTDKAAIDRYAIKNPMWQGGFVNRAGLYYTAGADHIFRLNPLSSSRTVHDFKKAISSLEISPDGEIAAIAAQGEVWLLNLADEEPKKTDILHSNSIGRLSFSPDGLWLLSCSGDGFAKLLNLKTYAVVDVGNADRRPGAAVHSVYFSPQGKTFAIVSDNQAAFYDLSDISKPRFILLHGSWIAKAGFTSDGRYFTTAATDNTSRIFDAATGKEVARHEDKNWLWASSLSADENFFASFSAESQVVIEATIKDASGSVTGLKAFTSIPLPASGQNLTFSSDSTHLAINQWGGRDYLFNLQDRNLFRLSCHNSFNSIGAVFSADDRYIATGQDHDAVIYQVSDGKPVQRLLHGDNITAVKFIGDRLISASRDGVVKITPQRYDAKVICEAAE